MSGESKWDLGGVLFRNSKKREEFMCLERRKNMLC
jgi:hypothetical protein